MTTTEELKQKKERFSPGTWYCMGAQIVRFWNDPSVPGLCDEQRIATVHGMRHGDGKANGALIAAAPDLYAALIACIDTLHNIHLNYGFGTCRSQTPADQEALETEIEKAWLPALAALAKARGDSTGGKQ